MSVTDKILEATEFKIYNEGKWNGDNMITDLAPGYTSFNDAGVEVEVGEFLYSMVRILQPLRVLETGTHIGVGACYMGMALKDNRQGHLDTLELTSSLADRARANLKALKLDQWVTSHLGDTIKWHPPVGDEIRPVYDLILLDTEPELRFEELLKYYHFLKDGGYVFIHDLHRHMSQEDNGVHDFGWPFGRLPDQINQWLKDDKLRAFHFGTPRGLTGFYKVHENDYQWITN